MQPARALLKRCIAYVLYWSGMLWLIARSRLRDRAVVLAYHRVLPQEADSFSDPGIVVTPETFRSNMRFLRRHFTPLSAREFERCLVQQKMPRHACLVTFDDGWYDNERYALPILDECDVPAIVFVATAFVGSGNVFWQERVRRQLFALSRLRIAEAPLLTQLGLGAAHLAPPSHARSLIGDFVGELKAQSRSAIEDTCARIESACRSAGLDTSSMGDDRFMDWDAVARLAARDRVSIGSHAHSHVPLTKFDRAAAAADLVRSVAELRRHGLPVPNMCAYPNGNYDSTILECLSPAGLTVGFTTEHGFVGPADDRRRLPRVNVHEGSAATAPEFLCRILGIF